MRIGITGHRPNKLPCEYDWNHKYAKNLRAKLREKIRSLKEGNDLIACTGMALGSDLFFAAVCFWEKVPFIGFCPCWGQENKWPRESQDRYLGLLKEAKEIRYVHNGPYPGPQCMLERNQAMIDWLKEEKDSILLAVWNGDQKGGTFDALRRAANAKIKTIVIDPNSIPLE